MKTQTRNRCLIASAVMALSLACCDAGRAQDALGGASWKQPPVAEVRQETLAWLDSRIQDPAIRQRAAELWPVETPAGLDVLDSVGTVAALVEPRAEALLKYCRTGTAETPLPDSAWLADSDLPPLVRNNLRLLVGRRLAQLQYFDEALAQLEGFTPQDVADPAALLYYSAVAHHRLLHQEEGLAAVGQLLQRRAELPARYSALATLIESDLRKLEDETLDHISRRMEDIERRLDQGRSGDKVRNIEDGVVKSLDKLIKKLEDQQAASAGAASLQPSAPAQDSKIAEGKGPGNVTKRDIGRNTGWGDLPPKQREEALQEIGRDFPANYKEIIEQYFREIPDIKEGSVPDSGGKK